MNPALLTLFIACVAVASLVQAGVLYAFYKSVRQSTLRMQEILGRLEHKTDPILTTTQAILEDAQPKISEITANLAEASAVIRAQVSQVADSTGEIVERVRMQAVRLDELVHSTLEKVETATNFLQDSVVRPVRRVHAIVQALGAGLSFFKRGHSQRRSPDVGGEEEEMFI